MNIPNCPDPTCIYNPIKKKCVKPNPYIQYLSQCNKKNIPKNECKKTYDINKDIIKKQACNLYRNNLQVKNNKSCPLNRQPVNNKCIHKDFNTLKNNKYGIPCCYKEKKPLKAQLVNATNKIKQMIRNKQLRDEFKGKQDASKVLQDIIRNKQLRDEFKGKQDASKVLQDIIRNKQARDEFKGKQDATKVLQDIIRNKQLRDEFKDKQDATKTIKDALKYLKAKKEFKEAKKNYNPFKFVKDDKQLNKKTGKINKLIDRYQYRKVPNKI